MNAQQSVPAAVNGNGPAPKPVGQITLTFYDNDTCSVAASGPFAVPANKDKMIRGLCHAAINISTLDPNAVQPAPASALWTPGQPR